MKKEPTAEPYEDEVPWLHGRLEIALNMAKRGFRIIPVYRDRKAVLTWRPDADNSTTDPEIITKWARLYPTANFAAVIEPGCGRAFLDLDLHDKDADGFVSFREAFTVDPLKIKTYKVRTKSGGAHLGFTLPEGFSLPDLTAQKALLPGVEIIGGKRQILVLAGSQGEGGSTYELLNDGAFADMPEYLLKAIDKAKAEQKKKKREPAGEGAPIPETERSGTLASLAGSMRRRGMGEEAIYQAILAENKRCAPPLEQAEIRSIAKSISKYSPGDSKLPGKLGAKIRAEQAAIIEKNAPPVPDPELRDSIFSLLVSTEENKSAAIRRQKAGLLLISWLRENGGFLRSIEGTLLYYFYKKDRKLFNLESNLWGSWLYSLTGANPASVDFSYLRSDCNTQALWAEKRRVVKVAYWDQEKKLLYVSRFDGAVYRLDGETWALEPNGENVLFEDGQTYLPYEPFTEGKRKPLRRMAMDLPAWDGSREEYGLAFLAWIVSTFFTELCPTRPIMALIGEKGSGKSMLLRMFLRFLFGPFGEVSGIPDKPDGFTAAADATHLMCLDNLDDIIGWLRDKLARLSTGGIDEYRKLYTSNEVGRIRYRCWLACTSRTPDTLRRDDLSDRLLILSVHRIAESELTAERVFLENTAKHRDEWWGDLFILLSLVVLAIRSGELSDKSILRMGDWESLGRVVAVVEGKEQVWDSFIKKLKEAQSTLLLEGDLIVDAIDKWLLDDLNYEKTMTSRELYNELTGALFGDRKPSGWYKSPQSFSHRMSAIRTDLAKIFNMRWEKGTTRKNRSRNIYWFGKGEKGEDPK